MNRIFFCAVVALAMFAASADANDLIALKDGSIYLGEVAGVTPNSITLTAVFPVAEVKTLAIRDLRDSTVWQIRSRRIASNDGEARLELGRWAEERELVGAALSEYRKAREVASARQRADERIRALQGRLAASLVERGQRYLVADRPASARQYFETVVRRYPDQPAAILARRGLKHVVREVEARKRAKRVHLLQRRRVEWEAHVGLITSHLDKAARYEADATHGSRSVRMTSRLKRAIHHLQVALALSQNLGNPPTAASLKSKTVDREVKQRLVKAYLDLGLAYLLRLSINQAEECCVKAGDLDPDNLEAHVLHQRVIDARIAASGHRGAWR